MGQESRKFSCQCIDLHSYLVRYDDNINANVRIVERAVLPTTLVYKVIVIISWENIVTHLAINHIDPVVDLRDPIWPSFVDDVNILLTTLATHLLLVLMKQ